MTALDERPEVRVMEDEWTGRRAEALRYALRMSQTTFAEILGVSPRAIAKWASKPSMVLNLETQRIMDTAYARLDAAEVARFRSALVKMSSVITWTGRHAAAVQRALRMTHDEFAEHMGVGRRTVAYWHANPHAQPRPEMQRALDTLYERLTEDQRIRFTHAIDQAEADPETGQESASTMPGFVGLSFVGGEPHMVITFDGGRRITLTTDESLQLAQAMIRAAEVGRG
ncbi:helix-turn-helix domain-containing protein [Nonomuraea sp. NPDC004580]|uniref:helix-turn-helix domain-containing protein n=1 Tax=Nonomuraea sp. NPDC004580 TaxID=3154552 RepID=UPI0033A23C68